MPETAKWIGGFVRWIFKGCKTTLRDEIQGNLEPSWGGTYEFENLIVGLVSVGIILGIVIFFIL